MTEIVKAQRYLLTGAQGFIGRHLISELLRHSQECTVLGIGRSAKQDLFFNYSLNCGNLQVPAKLPDYLHIPSSPRYRYISIDTTSDEFSRVVQVFCPTKVIHLAATLRGVSDDNILQNNVQSTSSLLHAIERSSVDMLLFGSSGGVYGKQDKFPIEESACTAPLDSYSRSKLASEDLVWQFAHRSGVPTAIARIFNVLGPGQDELHFAGRMASQIACILAGKSEPVIHARALSSTRDFLDVRDVSRALVLGLQSSLQGVFNVGSGIETRVDEILRIFLDSARLGRVSGKSIHIETDPTVADPIPRHVANMSRLARTGFAAQYSVERTCAQMLEYCSRQLFCAA